MCVRSGHIQGNLALRVCESPCGECAVQRQILSPGGYQGERISVPRLRAEMGSPWSVALLRHAKTPASEAGVRGSVLGLSAQIVEQIQIGPPEEGVLLDAGPCAEIGHHPLEHLLFHGFLRSLADRCLLLCYDYISDKCLNLPQSSVFLAESFTVAEAPYEVQTFRQQNGGCGLQHPGLSRLSVLGRICPPNLLPSPQPLARRPGIFIHGVGAAVL